MKRLCIGYAVLLTSWALFAAVAYLPVILHP